MNAAPFSSHLRPHKIQWNSRCNGYFRVRSSDGTASVSHAKKHAVSWVVSVSRVWCTAMGASGSGDGSALEIKGVPGGSDFNIAPVELPSKKHARICRRCQGLACVGCKDCRASGTLPRWLKIVGLSILHACPRHMQLHLDPFPLLPESKYAALYLTTAFR